jgi:hypothetical protein
MMREKILRTAVVPGLIALTAFLLLASFPFRAERADGIVGFGAVLALVGIAKLEYRISWKQLFGR